MNKDFYIVIPARLESTRLANKLMLDVAGKPLIVRVYEQALQAKAREVFVATDSDLIMDAIKNIGGNAVMTAKEHVSGSDRILEACKKLEFADTDIIVNLQGDEPLIPSFLINRVVAEQIATGSSVGTLATIIDSVESLQNPNEVKVVFDKNEHAMFFSRAPIPYNCSDLKQQAFRHIGIYSYNVAMLSAFSKWHRNNLEKLENLEQLRFLDNGIQIKVTVTDKAIPPGVDTLLDLDRVRKFFVSKHQVEKL